MKVENYDILYDLVLNQINETDTRAKDYYTVDMLSAWFCSVYLIFHSDKVITTRMDGDKDISIIVTHHKLSVINNETKTHSWVKGEELIQYEDIEEDVQRMLIALSFALLRSDVQLPRSMKKSI